MRLRRAGATRSRVTCHDHHAIGLDIGATSVRAAMLRVGSPGSSGSPASVVVDQVGSVALDPGIVVNGVVADPGALADALERLWKSARFGCTNVVLGIANSQVMVRELTMPHLPPGQQERALPFQARDVIAMPMEEVVLDFAPLGPPHPDTNQVQGLLVASPRGPVLSAVAAVERAGLEVVRVDLSSFALLRSVADPELRVEAVVDLGAHLTTVVVHQDGVPRLVRTLANGGQRLTEVLAERLGLGPEEAEPLKRTTALDGSGEANAALRDAAAPLLAEIRSSINYFRSSHTGAQLERISLVGGGAALGGLVQAVEAQTGAPTTVESPWDHVDAPRPGGGRREHIGDRPVLRPRDRSGGMSISTQDRVLRPTRPAWGISVDLTPPEVFKGRQVRGLQRGIGAALVLVLLLCVAASLVTLHGQSQAQDAYDTEQAHTQALQTDALTYADVTEIQAALAQIAGQVATVMSDDVDLVNLMARIRFALPDHVTITGQTLTLAPADAAAAAGTAVAPATLGSMTLTGNAGTIYQVASLVKALGALDGVADVVPTSTTRTGAGSVGYTVSFGLTDELRTHRFDPAGAK